MIIYSYLEESCYLNYNSDQLSMYTLWINTCKSLLEHIPYQVSRIELNNNPVKIIFKWWRPKTYKYTAYFRSQHPPLHVQCSSPPEVQVCSGDSANSTFHNFSESTVITWLSAFGWWIIWLQIANIRTRTVSISLALKQASNSKMQWIMVRHPSMLVNSE